MKILLALLAAAIVSGCADPIESAKEAVKAEAVNKNDIRYRNVEVFAGDVVCGEFEAPGMWGESSGFQYFIVRDDIANMSPKEEDRKIFCNENPAAALQDVYGISPLNENNETLKKIYDDLSTLSEALDLYLEDYNKYPTGREPSGISKLLKPRKGSMLEEDAYISAIPLDPWGNDYIYEVPRLLHGAAQGKRYSLYTLGEDGKPGGSGNNADIGKQHLKYLDHIAKL